MTMERWAVSGIRKNSVTPSRGAGRARLPELRPLPRRTSAPSLRSLLLSAGVRFRPCSAIQQAATLVRTACSRGWKPKCNLRAPALLVGLTPAAASLRSDGGLLSTYAVRPPRLATYCLEGSVLNAGYPPSSGLRDGRSLIAELAPPRSMRWRPTSSRRAGGLIWVPAFNRLERPTGIPTPAAC